MRSLFHPRSSRGCRYRALPKELAPDLPKLLAKLHGADVLPNGAGVRMTQTLLCAGGAQAERGARREEC